MITVEFDSTVTVDDTEIEVLVRAAYEAGSEIELLSVTPDSDGRELLADLPAHAVQALEGEALGRGSEAIEAEEMAAADAAFERKRDRMMECLR